MIIRLFMLGCFGIILPVMYFVLKHYGNPVGQLVFGVTIGSHHFEDEAIKQIQKQYIKEINWCGLISLLTFIGCAFIPYESIFLTALIAWMFLVIIAFEIPFMMANNKVKQLKADRGWNGEFNRTVIVDTEVAKLQDVLAFRGCYLASVVLSILPIVVYFIVEFNKGLDWNTVIVLGVLSLTTILMAELGVIIQKIHFKEYTTNSQINQAVVRTKRYHWAKGMAGMALATAIFTVILSVELCTGWMNVLVITIVSMVYSIFVVCYLFYSIYQAYKVRLKLVDGAEPLVSDDDEYWIHGLFYYNKNDTHFMVEKRVGIGTTVNMARPSAKVCMGILIVILLSIPLFSIWLIGDEFTPISLTVNEQAVISKQFEGSYTIPFGEISSVSVITDYGHASKCVGTNMDNLYRGDFSVKDYGRCKVCFDPRNKLFLVIKTGKKTYIISDETDAGTKAAYDKLLLKLRKL